MLYETFDNFFSAVTRHEKRVSASMVTMKFQNVSYFTTQYIRTNNLHISLILSRATVILCGKFPTTHDGK